MLRRIEGFWLFKLFWSLLLLILRWIEGLFPYLWIPLLVFWFLGIFGIFDIFRIRQLFFAGDPGAHLFLVWLSSSVIFLIPVILMMLRLHVHGARVTGIALHTWSETSTQTHTDDYGRKSTSTFSMSFTKVRYEVGAKRYTVTTFEAYAAGQEVPLVYNPTFPGEAHTESTLKSFAALLCQFPMIAGFFILWVKIGFIAFLAPFLAVMILAGCRK